MKLSTSTLAFFAAQTAVAAPRPIDTSSALSKRFSINDLVAAILSVFPVNILVGGLEGTLTDALQGVADGLGIETTLNASATCADITILFARGTEEPGNVGVVVGPAFFQAVEEKVGGSVSVTVQGTNNYAADIEGFLSGGDVQGTQQLASDITSTLARCPSTKLVVSGYSQGGQLVHNAAALVGATGMAGVSSVVIFGDPLNGYPVTGATTKTDVICAFGDDICLGGDLVLVQHLTYSLDADEAADYVAQKAGL